MRMRRWVMALLLVLLASLFLVGCGKKEKTEKQALEVENARLQAQVKQLEAKQSELTEAAQRAALKNTDELLKLEDALLALKLRVMHVPLEQFRILPEPVYDNGWAVISGVHTFTLLAHANATKVQFYWADATTGLAPRLLSEDSNGKDGWSYTGVLPFSTRHALWAEVHYPNGLKVTSAVLPLRSAGK